MNRDRAAISRISVLAFLLIIIAGSSVSALEFDHGFALRENALFMRWPEEIEPLYVYNGEQYFGISETRLRFWETVHAGTVSFEAALETRAGFNSSKLAAREMFSSDGSLLGSGKPLELWDMSAEHVSEDNDSLISRIDRLNARFSLGSFDFDVGRQPFSMGTSHFVGVLDIVAPFAPGDLDATYKPGVDAVRIRHGVGMTGEAELVYVAADDADESAYIGRYRTSLGMIDLELAGGRFRERYFGGAGWEGGRDPFGYWGEIAFFERLEEREQNRGGWSESAVSTVIGLDYYIKPNFIVGGAYMHQDFGVRDVDDLESIYFDAPFREGWSFLGASDYGLVTVSKELHPLIQADIAGIINLIDSSTLWQPKLTISTGDNTDVSVYGWVGMGEKNDSYTPLNTAKSEFGDMSDGGGFYMRVFF